MALIQRPVKTLGNREYAQEKAANPNEPIKSAEVDGDLDTIYALVNGQLDTANLKASAGILGTQLSAGANILGSQLSPTAGITAGQLAAGTLTAAQLAVGATVRRANFVAPNSVSATTTEATLCTVPLTTSGGYVIIAGWWDACLAILGTLSGTVVIRVRRDGTQIGVVSLAVQGNQTQLPVPAPLFVDALPAAAAHSYTITGMTSTTGIVLQTAGSGVVCALELA